MPHLQTFIIHVMRLVFDIFGELIHIHNDQYALFNIIHYIQRLNSHSYGHVTLFEPHQLWIHEQIQRLNLYTYGHTQHDAIEQVRTLFSFQHLAQKK